jgi:hypothetical protein
VHLHRRAAIRGSAHNIMKELSRTNSRTCISVILHPGATIKENNSSPTAFPAPDSAPSPLYVFAARLSSRVAEPAMAILTGDSCSRITLGSALGRHARWHNKSFRGTARPETYFRTHGARDERILRPRVPVVRDSDAPFRCRGTGYEGDTLLLQGEGDRAMVGARERERERERERDEFDWPIYDVETPKPAR